MRGDIGGDVKEVQSHLSLSIEKDHWGSKDLHAAHSTWCMPSYCTFPCVFFTHRKGEGGREVYLSHLCTMIMFSMHTPTRRPHGDHAETTRHLCNRRTVTVWWAFPTYHSNTHPRMEKEIA